MASPKRIEERSSREGLSEDDFKQSRGRLFFTNANSLKLVMPMPHNSESITFLLHTQQPLSYLETLIRNELTEAHPSPKITFWDVHRHSKWSTGVQISEFIREGAASKRFCIDISGTEESARVEVNVPNFEDRTQFLRAQLGRLTDTLQQQYKIKSECDELARKTAQKYALGGMAGLVTYWIVVFDLTFYTSLGWDLMEPVTYLTSLSALIGGYCWFLYHNRDVSYSSVLHTAATVRQQRLYKQKGFDIMHWRDLVAEGKDLRKEIRRIANEYNEDWNESVDSYISNNSSDASEILIKAANKEAKSRRGSDKEDDLADDGVINGSNEVKPGKE
ncbi:Putative uncharacterized protein [Taphrina deformans PYCC 5710]|uniref:Calcium uniporter protein n=1 Tax=Taphrina deformans (strain PYCC 5710 / ATCC 11124 / CBS 356.35 / IMI 108563 / JCM 9778 / NBRC 8474) TaxID=1097556 RepID=R4XBC0_TAPDE|nr:Putative uncharacterized protein [Taphrina deformans PYCC 5710]|eukprot:CCG83144.1 Putative uncharacterized protein [Taphrina deformans PYCC 5710]